MKYLIIFLIFCLPMSSLLSQEEDGTDSYKWYIFMGGGAGQDTENSGKNSH